MTQNDTDRAEFRAMRAEYATYRRQLSYTLGYVAIDTDDLRFAFDEGAPIEFVLKRMRAGRSVLWSDLPLSTTPSTNGPY
jgi:hypothetical protein